MNDFISVKYSSVKISKNRNDHQKSITTEVIKHMHKTKVIKHMSYSPRVTPIRRHHHHPKRHDHI
jgi:hypothetical protein